MLSPREGWAQAPCLGSQAVWTWRMGLTVSLWASPQGAEKGRAWVLGKARCTLAGHGVERKEWLPLRGLGCPQLSSLVLHGREEPGHGCLSVLGCGGVHPGSVDVFCPVGLTPALMILSLLRCPSSVWNLPPAAAQGAWSPHLCLPGSEDMDKCCKHALLCHVTCLFVLAQLLTRASTGECALLSLPMSPCSDGDPPRTRLLRCAQTH